MSRYFIGYGVDPRQYIVGRVCCVTCDEDGFSAERGERGDELLDEGEALFAREGEEGFVTAHACAAPAREDDGGRIFHSSTF